MAVGEDQAQRAFGMGYGELGGGMARITLSGDHGPVDFQGVEDGQDIRCPFLESEHLVWRDHV
jgi:hypothetical protein